MRAIIASIRSRLHKPAQPSELERELAVDLALYRASRGLSPLSQGPLVG